MTLLVIQLNEGGCINRLTIHKGGWGHNSERGKHELCHSTWGQAPRSPRGWELKHHLSFPHVSPWFFFPGRFLLLSPISRHNWPLASSGTFLPCLLALGHTNSYKTIIYWDYVSLYMCICFCVWTYRYRGQRSTSGVLLSILFSEIKTLTEREPQGSACSGVTDAHGDLWLLTWGLRIWTQNLMIFCVSISLTEPFPQASS